jgi:DNA-3-methyladenine glycosylase II
LPLNSESLAQAAIHLSQVDADLARLHLQHGPPPLWDRPPGFATLIYIILEQQVSLASAAAAFHRLEVALGVIDPGRFLQLQDDELKQVGFSRQKMAYGRQLAQSIQRQDLDLDGLAGLDDHSARAELIRMKGIGPWTADIYLMEALLRPDIWPVGDLALVNAIQELKGLAVRPGPQEMESIASTWQPWRAVAARMLWHDYLHKRNPAWIG